MQDLNDKTTGNSLSASEWNQQPSELQNVITQRGIVLSGGDLDQLGKAIAGYVANGSFFVDSGVANLYLLATVNNIQAAPNYRDGDEISFFPANANTGASTVNRAAVGAINLKDQFGNDLTANALTPDSLAVARFISGEFRLQPSLNIAIQSNLKSGRKNKLINGDFLINQRGITFAPATNVFYTSDQWAYTFAPDGGVLGSNTVDIESFVNGQTDVPNNPRNFLSVSGTIAGGGGLETVGIRNAIEEVSTLSGELTTFSFWAKGSINGDVGASITQNFGETIQGADAPVYPLAEIFSVTTTWQKYTFTFEMPSVGGKVLAPPYNSLNSKFFLQSGAARSAILGFSGAISYAGVLSIADVQIESGSFGTEYDRLLIGDSFLLCQRYYQTMNWDSVGAILFRGSAAGFVHSQNYMFEAMRTNPTITVGGGAGLLSFFKLNGNGDIGGLYGFNFIPSTNHTLRIETGNNGTAVDGDFYGSVFLGGALALISAEL
jgi:hypothetical protein